MSAGNPHKRVNEAEPKKLRKYMASPSFQEMWARPFTVVTTYQIPDTGGYSVKADHYYLDIDFVRKVKSGEISVAGMQPDQILGAVLRHERVEKCLMDADNDIDIYEPAHEYATCAEHMGVRPFAHPYKYEQGIHQTLVENEKKPLNNVPPDLGCAPYIDDPDELDKQALAQLKALGVVDCGKLPKSKVEYSESTGADECQGCKHWQPEAGFSPGLAACALVAGAVRDTHWCNKFEQGSGNEQEPDEGPLDG